MMLLNSEAGTDLSEASVDILGVGYDEKHWDSFG